MFMKTSFKKWYLLFGLYAVMIFCLLGCINLVDNFSTTNPTKRLPIKTLRIQIDESQHEELFNQMKFFSQKHNLEFHLSFQNNNETFFIDMEGQGLQIVSLSFVNDNELNFRFFEKEPNNPPKQETVDNLYDELKIFLHEISSVVIILEEY